MLTSLPQLYNWLLREDGQDLTEYALITFFISLVVVSTLPVIGGTIVNMYVWIVAQIP